MPTNQTTARPSPADAAAVAYLNRCAETLAQRYASANGQTYTAGNLPRRPIGGTPARRAAHDAIGKVRAEAERIQLGGTPSPWVAELMARVGNKPGGPLPPAVTGKPSPAPLSAAARTAHQKTLAKWAARLSDAKLAKFLKFSNADIRAAAVAEQARRNAGGKPAEIPASQRMPGEPKARAGWEWDYGRVDRRAWISRDIYITARARELKQRNR